MESKRLRTPKIAVNTIDGLHVDILSCIVSLMTIKEAARTSILSRKWRNLWKTSMASFPRLHLDILPPKDPFYLHNEFGDCIDGGSYYSFTRPSNWPAIENHKFVGFVFQILHLDHSSVRDSSRFRFYLENDFARHNGQWIITAMTQLNDSAHDIGQWIDVAIAEGCVGMDLSHLVIRRGIYHDGNHYYQYPSLLSAQEKEKKSFKNRFSLRRCSVRTPDSSAYLSLIDLRLKNIVIEKEDTDSILSNCPNLEKLNLYKCKGWHTVNISGPTLKLKQLIILYCDDIKLIILDAKNLTQLMYVHIEKARVNLMPINVPQLSNMIFRSEGANSHSVLGYACGNMSTDFPHLQSMMISVIPLEAKKLPKQLSLYCNLKKLVLLMSTCGGTLWSFIPLLQETPCLRWLELNLEVCNILYWEYDVIKEDELMDRPCEFSLPRLKNIILAGFRGSSHEIEFATYLLNTAINLKRFTVFFNRLLYECKTGDMYSSSKERMQTPKWKNKRAWKKLMNLRKPKVKFAFFY